MPSLRRIARVAEKLIGARIVSRRSIDNGSMFVIPEAEIGINLERAHLRRFFTHFRIDCLFDVGANAGQYAQMVRSLGFQGPIISFEPLPAMIDLLRQKARGDKDWFIEGVALDEVEREVTFNVMASPQFSSLKAPSHREVALFGDMNKVVATVPVRTTPLAPIFQRYRERLGFSQPFLKMDTQGNDIRVARGAGPHLSEFVGLQSELAVKRLYEDQVDYRAALSFFEAEGFELSALVPNNLGHFPDLIEIDCIMYNGRLTGRGRRGS